MPAIRCGQFTQDLPDTVMLGTKIAHYMVEMELGRGGMGVVYRAKDLQLERTVALKLLSEEYARHAEQRQMILAEARVAASMNHPGVTTIFEVGEHRAGSSPPWSL
jgi:serine/threonine protein kinase